MTQHSVPPHPSPTVTPSPHRRRLGRILRCAQNDGRARRPSPTRTLRVKFHYSSFIIHHSLKAKLPRIIPREFVLCWHLLIFPGRYQPSIVSASELNFRVRDGNGCTLTAINTNYSVLRSDEGVAPYEIILS